MNSAVPSSSLPDSVEHLAASVVGLATRRTSGSGVVWRSGVVVTNASVLWRASSLSLVLPDGEQVQGEIRGLDSGTDLAAVTFAGGSIPVTERASAASPRVGDFVFAVGRDTSGLTQATFGHGVLGISVHTAKYHVGQILAKVGASTRAEAVSEGLRYGWIGL